MQQQRSFSGTPSARITLEEDDEDDPETVAYNGRHSKRPGEISTGEVDLRNILSSRASKPKRRQPPKRLDPQELREIEEKAQVLLVTPQFYQEYVDLKHAPLEDRISQYARYNRRVQKEYDQLFSSLVGNLENLVQRSSEKNRILEHEYCTVKFRESPILGNSVARLDKMIASLRHEVFKAVVECVEAFVVNFSQMLEVEYLGPRQSARAKIDELLNSRQRIQRQYRELQEKGNAAKYDFRDIRHLCIELIKANPRRHWELDEILDRHRMLQRDFDVAAHLHRRWWMKRHHSRHPLMESASLLAGGMIDQTDRLFRGITVLDVVRAMMHDGKVYRIEAGKLARRHHAIADALRVGYMKTWNGPKPVDDPFLSTLWRQLDLTAPFDILYAFDSLMVLEIWYLIGTIQGKLGPMWDNLTPRQSDIISGRLYEWAVEFRQRQKEFISEYTDYKQISLIRFEIEKRLHELDMSNDIRARGLFVAPNPLSQDHAQFRRWVMKYCSITFDAFCMQKVHDLLTLPKVWDRLVNEYHAIGLAKRNGLIQKFGSVRGRRRRGRAKPELRYLGRNRKRSLAARLTRKGFKHSARSKGKQESLAANQQPAAGSLEAPRQSMKSHEAPRATSTLNSGLKVRMRTAMRWLKNSIIAKPSDPSHTSKPTVERAKSAHRDQPGRESTDNSPQNSSPQPAAPGRQTAPNSSATRPARLASSHGKPWARSYCTDSRFSRNATRKDHDQRLLDQKPGSCIPVIAAPTETRPRPARTVVSRDPTISSTSRLKAEKAATPLFWSHNLHRGPDGRKLIVNYCQSLATAERVAQHFLGSKVIGFDMEWGAQARSFDSIQNNLSLIQLANEERIALFHIAKFNPARNLQDLVPPTLNRILESHEITKVGVAIKADSNRLRRYLGIEARTIFELSHLYKLVKYGLTEPKLVNKRSVSLSQQIEDHFGLPLNKDDDVRCGNWTGTLDYRQVQCE